MIAFSIIIIFSAYNRAAASADDPHDELKICCGQLISREAGWEHKLCDRNEEDYHVGGLVIELERCPHIGCGSVYYEPFEKYCSPRYCTPIYHTVLMWGMQGLLCDGGGP